MTYLSGDDPLAKAVGVLGRLAGSNDRLEETAMPIVERYRNDPSSYEDDRKTFERDHPEWMGFFERVINNSMMYECFPFVDRRFDRTQAYKGLCVCYGLMRIVCIGNHHFHQDKDSLTAGVEYEMPGVVKVTSVQPAVLWFKDSKSNEEQK